MLSQAKRRDHQYTDFLLVSGAKSTATQNSMTLTLISCLVMEERVQGLACLGVTASAFGLSIRGIPVKKPSGFLRA